MPVSNPYAKKKKTAEKSQNSTSITSAETVTAATFSQAFSCIEETSHYQSELKKTDTPVVNTVAERAQQREFDTKAARDEVARLEAREHHALLQPHVLYVSTKQRGNPILKYIRNVPYAYSKMVPDYIMSSQRCALFLSMKYHALYPNYIHRRIAELKTDFKLRVLMVLVDVDDNANFLLFLNRLAVIHSLTLILAWSEEEAARYLETYKAFDGKDAALIQKRAQTNFVDQLSDFLCTVRSVNQTDSGQLLSQFGSVKQMMTASEDELTLCPGLGEKKVKRLWEAFHKPFSSKRAKKRKQEAQSLNQQQENDARDGEISATGRKGEDLDKKQDNIKPDIQSNSGEKLKEGKADGLDTNNATSKILP
mmetsp:Transcript_13042/g.19191  ORF Transcript_13042/g.19191 Transcript_13042/m.19191 type:complete len:366 (-) Transcript_13042:1991-3088(-)